MRARRGAVVSLLLSVVGACARPAPTVPSPVAVVDLQWAPFFWARVAMDSLVFPQAAILVETTLRPGGAPSLLQMDLGASAGMPDGFPAPPSEDRRPVARRTGQLHGLLAASAMVTMPRPAAPPESLATREIGTLGLPNYEVQGLILDLPRQRYATFSPQQDLATALGTPTITVPIEFAGNRVIVPLELADGRVARALLDTGLSPFPLWTTRALWEDLTGRRGPGPGTRQYTFHSRRGPMRFIGAPVVGRLGVGTAVLKGLEVVYMSDGPPGAPLDDWTPRLDGVISPRALAPDQWLVLDLFHRRLGLSRPRTP